MEMNSPPVSLEGNQQSPKDPDKELSPGLKILKTWFIYRIPTLLAWVWLFLRFSGWTLPIELRLESYLPLPYLFCFVIFVISGHWTLAFGYPFYFIFSPLLIVIEPVAFIIRTFTTSSEESSKLIRCFVKVVTFLRSFKAIIILILLVISAWTATVFYVAPTNRPALALAAHVITYILFLQSFRWAANPYKPILLGLGLVSRVGESILRKIFVEPNLKKKMEERESSYQTCRLIISGLDRIHNPETRLTNGITSVTHGRLAAIFTGFFFFMYLLVASSVSFP